MRTVRYSGRQEGVAAQGSVYPSMHWAGGCVYTSMHWVGGLPQCMLGYTPPPWTELLIHACENITFPQLRCGGKYVCVTKAFKIQIDKINFHL